MVEVKVKGIVSEKSSRRYNLLLEDKDRRVILFSLGLLEAQTVILELKKINPDQPVIYGLITSLLSELSARLIRVEIVARRNDEYLTQLVVQLDDRLKYFECRPSEGVILALRHEVPVFVQEDLMKEASAVFVARRRNKKDSGGTDLQPLNEDEAENIIRDIETLSTEEFWRKVKTR